MTRELRAAVVLFALSVGAGGCTLERSGTAPRDGAPVGQDTGPPGMDGGGTDAGGIDSGGMDAGGDDAGVDAGFDAGVDSAVPITDSCVATAEICDGMDNDCNGVADDMVQRPCSTACGMGIETCTLGTWFCSAPDPMPEVCDGMDNDCNGVPDDALTRTCSNACGTGFETCIAGSFMACTAPLPIMEICDNVDNDCNGMVDDGLTRSCADACGGLTGIARCSGGFWGACMSTLAVETCNGRDDDCDGTIDNGAGCPCIQRYHGGHAYLFCTTGNNYLGALAACRANGYELITVNTDAENTFAEGGLSDVNDDWWIGFSDRGREGTWVWDFSFSTYDDWAPGEPNGWNSGDDCGVIENGSSSFEDRGFWGDHNCSNVNPYICESR